MSDELKNEDYELKALLQKNIALSEEISENLVYIKKYVKWQKVWSAVRLLIVVIPLVIGFLYLPPLIKEYFASYGAMLK